MIGFLEKYVLPVAGKIQEQKHLQSVRDGIILAMPLIIVGSFFLIIGNLPIPHYEAFMSGLFGKEWLTKLTYPVGATFDIMSIIIGFGVAYRLAERYKVDALSAGAISLASFLLATPHMTMFTPEGTQKAFEVGGVLPISLMGSKGLFVAMIIAIVSTEIYRWVIQRKLVINMPQGVPPAVAKSFVALIPAFIVITFIWIIRVILEATSLQDIHHVINLVITTPLSFIGGSLWGMLIAILAIQILWSLGLHGDAIIIDSLMAPVLFALMDENRQVFMADHSADLPNIISAPFYSIFMTTGGSGLTIALVLLMLFKARSKQMKQLGRLAVGPSLFNINEPTIFGTPIVMNPLMIIPFILTPVVVLLVTYFSMDLGLVAKPNGVLIPWTTPMFISGFLATGGKVSGIVIQIVNLAVALIIYYPFMRLYDKQKFNEEKGFEQIKSEKDLNHSI
ncbi:PTS system lichenan oligosaccharide-specific IIC component (Lac family) [Scopulibacillus darangshiensis]|uniref:Permease IIC component n=1 Tax=Scopulibacillus darangshiensis TaxID=442528 RepID=A0A4R2P2J6_9BACL|nr:PTS cellobiose transporter subunit IIC [Scopulibacillus darangshiensis]TCP28910.1 PTS system lichenan oligosaccharide-specific IIC component (Lac family) [Scopulibacillus darangshiensis]